MLSRTADDRQHEKRRRDIIHKALDLIRHIHNPSDTSSLRLDQLEPIPRQNAQRVIDTLLDLLILEGIYPSLTPGVGVPVEYRLKSALKNGLATRPLSKPAGQTAENQKSLSNLVDSLVPIMLSRQGLASGLQERMSLDLITAAGELAFSPAVDNQTRQRSGSVFESLMNR